MMRGRRAAVVLVAVLPAAGCADEERKMATANVLELQLGEGGSLAKALRMPPPGLPTTRTDAALPPSHIDPHERDTEPARAPAVDTDPRRSAPEPAPEPAPRQPPPPAVAPRIVELGEGETLYGLCRTHLGDGGRWKEVARLNGWSTTQAEHLPSGQQVRLPAR